MKTKICILLGISLFVQVAFAGLSRGGRYSYNYQPNRNSDIYLVKKAEYVSSTLTINCKEKELKDCLNAVRLTRQLLIKQAEKVDFIIIKQGIINVSKLSTKVFSSYAPSISTEMQLIVLYKLTDKTDLYSAVWEIKEMVDSVNLPDKTSISIGNANLTIENPEGYRKKLLQKIGEDVNLIGQSIGTNGKVRISGLDKPISVRQRNNEEIELFIDYSLSFESDVENERAE